MSLERRMWAKFCTVSVHPRGEGKGWSKSKVSLLRPGTKGRLAMVRLLAVERRKRPRGRGPWWRRGLKSGPLKGGTPKLPGGGRQEKRCVFAIHSKKICSFAFGCALATFPGFRGDLHACVGFVFPCLCHTRDCVLSVCVFAPVCMHLAWARTNET